MAVSYLKETIRKFAQDKKLDWLDSRDSAIRNADKALDSGNITLDEAMEIIEETFHSDWVNRRVSDNDFRELKKKIGYKVNK